MNLREMSPEDLLEPSWIVTYEQSIEVLFQQLVRLNSSIFVLEKILAFRFDLFKPYPRLFWNLVESALFETCILIVWRVAIDSSDEGITLRQLKNEIFQHFRKDEYKDWLARIVKSAGFERVVSNLEPKIIALRHDCVAHFNFGANVNPTPEQRRQRKLLFSELKKYRDAVNSFFDIFCFSRQRLLLPLGYHPDVVHPVDDRSDIEQLLDDLARDSVLLNLPEENPHHWAGFRNNLSEQDLQTVNKYRAKFGLPEV